MNKERHVLIAERRKELGMTQQELADRIEVSRGRIGQFETGSDIPDNHLVAISRELKLPLDVLRGAASYVKTEADVSQWRKLVYADFSLSPGAQLVLIWLPELLDELRGGYAEFNGSTRRVADLVRSMSLEQVDGVWGEVLASAYIERHSDSEWCLRLKFPLGHPEGDSNEA